MKKWSIIILIFLFTFTNLIGCSKDEKKEKKIEKKKIHMVAVGDSLTVGLKGTNGGYVGIIEEELKKEANVSSVKVDNFAIVGNRTEQLIERLNEKEVQKELKDADFILLTIGGNDMMKTVRNNALELKMKDFEIGQKEYNQKLHTIFKKLRSLNKKSPIYYVGLYNPFEETLKQVPEIGEIIQSYNEVAKKATNDYNNVRYISVYDEFLQSKEHVLSDDQFHPNDKGYQIIAEVTLKEIRKDF